MVNDLGDWAIVNVQTSAYSSAESLSCVVNLSLAPGPWPAEHEKRYGALPRRPSAHHGLYRGRLNPTGSPNDIDVWWQMDEPSEVPDVAADIVRRLDRDGWPTLERLLNRDHLVAQIKSGELDSGLALSRARLAEVLTLLDVGGPGLETTRAQSPFSSSTTSNRSPRS